MSEQTGVARCLGAEEQFAQHRLQVDDVVEVAQGVRPESERAQVYRKQIVVHVQTEQNVLHSADIRFELHDKVGFFGIVEVNIHGDIQNDGRNVHIEHYVHGTEEIVKRETRGHEYVARYRQHNVGKADCTAYGEFCFFQLLFYQRQVYRQRNARVEQGVDKSGKEQIAVFVHPFFKVHAAVRAEHSFKFALNGFLIGAEQFRRAQRKLHIHGRIYYARNGYDVKIAACVIYGQVCMGKGSIAVFHGAVYRQTSVPALKHGCVLRRARDGCERVDQRGAAGTGRGPALFKRHGRRFRRLLGKFAFTCQRSPVEHTRKRKGKILVPLHACAERQIETFEHARNGSDGFVARKSGAEQSRNRAETCPERYFFTAYAEHYRILSGDFVDGTGRKICFRHVSGGFAAGGFIAALLCAFSAYRADVKTVDDIFYRVIHQVVKLHVDRVCGKRDARQLEVGQIKQRFSVRVVKSEQCAGVDYVVFVDVQTVRVNGERYAHIFIGSTVLNEQLQSEIEHERRRDIPEQRSHFVKSFYSDARGSENIRDKRAHVVSAFSHIDGKLGFQLESVEQFLYGSQQACIVIQINYLHVFGKRVNAFAVNGVDGIAAAGKRLRGAFFTVCAQIHFAGKAYGVHVVFRGEPERQQAFLSHFEVGRGHALRIAAVRLAQPSEVGYRNGKGQGIAVLLGRQRPRCALHIYVAAVEFNQVSVRCGIARLLAQLEAVVFHVFSLFGGKRPGISQRTRRLVVIGQSGFFGGDVLFGVAVGEVDAYSRGAVDYVYAHVRACPVEGHAEHAAQQLVDHYRACVDFYRAITDLDHAQYGFEQGVVGGACIHVLSAQSNGSEGRLIGVEHAACPYHEYVVGREFRAVILGGCVRKPADVVQHFRLDGYRSRARGYHEQPFVRRSEIFRVFAVRKRLVNQVGFAVIVTVVQLYHVIGSCGIARPGKRGGAVAVIGYGYVLSVYLCKAVAAERNSGRYVDVGNRKVLSRDVAFARGRRERFVSEVVKLLDYRVEVDIYIPYLGDKVVHYVVYQIGYSRPCNRESAQRDTAEVDDQFLTLQINAYQLDFAAACRILYLYSCGGIFTAVGINVQIYVKLYAQTFKVEQDFAQVDFYARLVEDVSEYACKADIGFGTFRKFKFEGRAEVEHLVDNTFNEHMTRIRSALRDFLRFRTNFLRPVRSAADSHVGYAYRAFRFGAFIIHIVVELSHKVQLHPVGIIFVAADGKVDCRVVIAQVGVHAEQVEERFNRGEGHHGDDVVLRYADEHRLVCGKTRPVAVTVCLGKVCRGNVALAAFIGRRLPVAAVNDTFGIVERLSEHVIHKPGYVEVGGMVLGHRYAEQVEVGQVDVQVVAGNYQIQEVGACPEQYLILYCAVFVLRRAHYHILVKGELDRAQRIFRLLRVKGQAERKR